MREITETYEICVSGGGLAGVCAAIAAARHGARTVIIQDRPVFGGNSSSEVRVTPHGAAAHHAYARETGIISELLIEERARNHEEIFANGWTNSVWDLVLYEAVMAEPNLTLRVNTTVEAVVMDGRRLAALRARVAGAETIITVRAQTFIDCTGDGSVAAMAGCEWRMGSEGRAEFDEPHAPEHASDATMGSSIHFKTRDIGRPAPFTPPIWAIDYEDASFFYDHNRSPRDIRGGFWWLEISVPWHTIFDAEDIRHELTRHALGVWNWIKNKDPQTIESATNYALDWIGQVPGKRESRRIMGQYLMTEHDVQNKTVFADEVAFGGWFIDLHTPGGLLAATSEPPARPTSFVGPFGIPLRILLAKDVDNLLLAGRNVSVTHVALGSVRVQGTTALMGQAAGTAAAIALQQGIPVAHAPQHASAAITQRLLRDGCFLPNTVNEDCADLARSSQASASSAAQLRGAGPHTRGCDEGVAPWVFAAREAGVERLRQRRGQYIAIGMQRIDRVSVCVSNLTTQEQPVAAELRAVDHIWDYRCDAAAVLARTTLRVPPGREQWVDWPLDLDVTPGRYVRLDLLANPMVEWHAAGAVEPGHVSAIDVGTGKIRRHANASTQSFRIAPPQPCFEAGNVLSGVTRPYRFTNLWRSDPDDPLPQWLQLDWREPQTIAQVELTFPGQLLREYHAYLPFYRDPQCAKAYAISAFVAGTWSVVAEVSGNYQRHRRHTLREPVTTDRLRITILATNGDPSAAIYEVRCYGAV